MRGFQVGDRVESPSGMRGRVSKIGDAVHVEYEDRGKVCEGVYDEVWFQQYEPLLKNLTRPHQ